MVLSELSSLRSTGKPYHYVKSPYQKEFILPQEQSMGTICSACFTIYSLVELLILYTNIILNFDQIHIMS